MGWTFKELEEKMVIRDDDDMVREVDVSSTRSQGSCRC